MKPFITAKALGLPRSYSVVAWVSYTIGNGSHYEAAQFVSSTPGQVDVFAQYEQHAPTLYGAKQARPAPVETTVETFRNHVVNTIVPRDIRGHHTSTTRWLQSVMAPTVGGAS